jgi:hypothetical protein
VPLRQVRHIAMTDRSQHEPATGVSI